MGVVGPAPQTRLPNLRVLWPRLGTGQPLGCAMVNLFSLGVQVDGPNWLGLLASWARLASMSFVPCGSETGRWNDFIP